jgi:hypothetical protein
VSIVLKIFTNYVQLISTLSSLGLSLPEGFSIFSGFTEAVGNPAEEIGVSLDCILQKYSNGIAILYVKLLFSVLLVMLYELIYIFGEFVYIRWTRKYKRKCDFAVSVMFVYLFMQPSIVS